MPALTKASLAQAVELLASRDSDLAGVVERCGAPAFWSRPRGFATLAYIILEQQVSLASARATYDKLSALLPEFTESNYLELPDETLRAAGVSRQKQRYTRLVAKAILDGSLPLMQLGRRSDAEARELLTSITGIGNWTADVYLMVALRRPDLWPTGDLALVKAAAELKGRAANPDRGWLETLGEHYRPYRSVATRIFWHHYLHG